MSTKPIVPKNREQMARAEASAGASADGSFTVTSRSRADETLGLNSNIEKSAYGFDYFTFPSDIHADDINHYMVININVPVNRVFDAPRGRFIDPSQVDMNTMSKVDQLRSQGAISLFNTQQKIAGTTSTMSDYNDTDAGAVVSKVADWFGVKNVVTGGEDVARIGRGTRRLKSSIALYMPTPVIFNQVHDYEEVKLTNMIINGIGSGFGALAAGLGSAWSGKLATGTGAGSTVQTLLNSINGETVGTASRLIGYPINPRVEVLFANTQLRQFVFEFLLAPRSEQESLAIASIIRSLRFHAAPELDNGGFTFIPPAEFDITFYHKGKENTTIPRINTCLLERVEVDYAPTGTYSTFSNGYPVATRLSLGFREVEVIHKKRIYDGY